MNMNVRSRCDKSAAGQPCANTALKFESAQVTPADGPFLFLPAVFLPRE